MSKAEYAARWAQLFGVPTSTIDPHRDPSKSPTIGSINAGNNVASVVWVGTGSNNEINAQTDAGHRIRVTAGAAPINPNTDICVITFATPYRYKRPDGSTAPMVPQIHTVGPFSPYSLGSYVGYALQTREAIPAGNSVDISVIVEPGCATV